MRKNAFELCFVFNLRGCPEVKINESGLAGFACCRTAGGTLLQQCNSVVQIFDSRFE